METKRHRYMNIDGEEDGETEKEVDTHMVRKMDT